MEQKQIELEEANVVKQFQNEGKLPLVVPF